MEFEEIFGKIEANFVRGNVLLNKDRQTVSNTNAGLRFVDAVSLMCVAVLKCILSD